MSFGIEREVTDGVHVVSLRGELDLATAPELRELLEEELDAEAPILIDLTKCEFIDSTGVAVIVRAWQQRQSDDGVPPSGGLLGLCSPDKQVSRLLEVTGVDTSITVFAECEEGVTELRSRAEQTAPER
jgi:anti-sigma B factor antagonist